MITIIEGEREHPAPFRLHRLVEWGGLNWQKDIEFHRVNTPEQVMALGSEHVILALGQQAQELTTGLHRNILDSRGYIYPSLAGGSAIPTVAPAFIQRGNARWSAPFIADLQKAYKVSKGEMPPQILNYVLDPSPLEAYRWAQQYRQCLGAGVLPRLAFDIETPGKGEDEDDVELGDAPDRTWHIDRISFSYGALSAISFVWEPAYMAAVRLLLGSPGDKVVWNQGFDVPRLRRAGIQIDGLIHDGMIAWHILHTDLPKKLGFVATFTCPWQPAWKHLSGAKPAFYSATDSDVEWRSMEFIEAELRRNGLWEVYQRDILDLDPLLVHMHNKGMPVDAQVRQEKAIELSKRLTQARRDMEACIPIEARTIAHVYTNIPKSTQGLLSRPASRQLPVCSNCGAEKPPKSHFKRFVKKHNPCADAATEQQSVGITEYYRLGAWTPSVQQLKRYHQHHKRPCITIYDKSIRGHKVSFNLACLRKLMLKYPTDPLYATILNYRRVQKIATTYVGLPEETIDAPGTECTADDSASV